MFDIQLRSGNKENHEFTAQLAAFINATGNRWYERVAGLGYPTDVEVERVYDPLDWEAMGMERGTPFALAHTFRQTGPFRPGNVDRRVPGLVFTGSSTVPGVGVPMVLVSGKLAAQRVDALAATGAVGR